MLNKIVGIRSFVNFKLGIPRVRYTSAFSRFVAYYRSAKRAWRNVTRAIARPVGRPNFFSCRSRYERKNVKPRTWSICRGRRAWRTRLCAKRTRMPRVSFFRVRRRKEDWSRGRRWNAILKRPRSLATIRGSTHIFKYQGHSHTFVVLGSNIIVLWTFKIISSLTLSIFKMFN